MLIIMKKNAADDALEGIKEYLINKDFDIHQSTGANRTIIGVIGETDTLKTEDLQKMPGVHQIVRISKEE